MIYTINSTNDKGLERIFKESMRDLKKFYELNWVDHIPRVIVVPNRKTIDLLRGMKTEPWLLGWADGRMVYILDSMNFEKESNHKYNSARYYSLLKHELSHAFYHIISHGQYIPVWLCEGVAIYTAGQIKEKTRPTKFKEFLKFQKEGGKGVYSESGFAVELLVKKFGKQKLLKLIKGLKENKSRSEFEKWFKTIYKFKPTYKEFNRLYLE